MFLLSTNALLATVLNPILNPIIADAICDAKIEPQTFDHTIAAVNLTNIKLEQCHLGAVELYFKEERNTPWQQRMTRPPSIQPIMVNMTGFSCGFYANYSYRSNDPWGLLSGAGVVQGAALPETSVNLSLSMDFHHMPPVFKADSLDIDIHLSGVTVSGPFGETITHLVRDSRLALRLFEVHLADAAAGSILYHVLKHATLPSEIFELFHHAGALVEEGISPGRLLLELEGE
jgi:hypothetical protein